MLASILTKRENYVAAVEKNERFYIDAGEYINQKEFQGDEFLITAPSNQIQWTLKNEKKQILGFECLKAEYISTEHGKSLKVVAWYAPKLPFQFGPKGYHGLPGLILQLVQNNKIIYTADSIMEDANVWVLKPTTGKKITLEKFNTLVDATATEMEASRKN
jgi:GLPGLI family protein